MGYAAGCGSGVRRLLADPADTHRLRWEAGDSPYELARLIGAKLRDIRKQPVVVENHFNAAQHEAAGIFT